IERVYELRTAAALHARAESARGIVGVVRARRDFAVRAFGREPHFEVVLLRGRRTEIAGCDVDDAIRKSEPADNLLFNRQDALVLGFRLIGNAEHEHLDFVELMHAEDAARIFAVGSRLAAEACGEAAVAGREITGREGVAAV